MTIWYVFMSFPAPSETFAGVEVRALHEQGADISVHSLRMPHRDAARLRRDWGIEEIPACHGSWIKAAKGLFAGLLQLPVMVDLIVWILKRTWNKPTELGKSLVLVPLVCNLFVEIQLKRPDVVHLFWGHYPALLGYLVRRHCPDVVLSLFLGAYDLRQGFPCSIDVAKRADVVWTHTRYNIADLEALGIPGKKIRLNYRGINLANVRGATGSKVAQRIVTAGRLLKFKGIDDVLRVFQKIRLNCPHATLVILGDGPEMAALRKLAIDLGVEAAVTFKGQVTHAQVYAEMKQAEIFLFMSKTERLPNVIKEAMACRCLCVTTETPGIGELIRDGDNGVISPDDIDTAASLVSVALQKPDEYRRMAEQGRKTVMEQFDVDRNVVNYLSAWQELARNRQPLPEARAPKPSL